MFRTHSLSRCCLYQATRDVDVAVKAPAVSVVSEGGVLWGTESCAACVLWVYARFPHAALDNPAWSAVIVLSRHVYPQPAHVVHGVLLHLIPMSWSWTHFKLLPLSSLRSRHAPHRSLCTLSSPNAHRLRIAMTRIHTQTRQRAVHEPLPLPTSWRGLSHPFTLSRFHTEHSGLLPCTHCLHSCLGGG